MKDSHSILCGHQVHRLGIGTGRLASLGAGYSRKDAMNLLLEAAEIGVNLIDTADTYGSSDCERLLGDLMRFFPNQFIICTKAGYPYSEFLWPLRSLNQFGKKIAARAGSKPCFEATYIQQCIENSLRRLRLERIDFFLLHDPPTYVWEEDALRNVIENAKLSGKILHFGISASTASMCHRAESDSLVELVESPVNPSLPPQVKRLPLIANHVFGAGSLLNSSLKFHITLEKIAGSRGKSARDILIAFAAGQPNVRCVLIGTGRADHLRTNARALEINLTSEEIESLGSAASLKP